MAQRRLINRSLGSSMKMLELVRIAGSLADFCHALFPLLVVDSDDHGRQEGDAARIKFRVFPVSPHPEGDFEKALLLMERVGLLSLYTVGGRRYLIVHKFRDEQPGIKYIAKSCCPEPPQEVLEGQRLAGFHRIGGIPGPDEEKKLYRGEVKRNEENLDAPLAHSAAGAASEIPSNGSVGAPAMKTSSHEAEGSHPQRKIRHPSRSRRAPEDFRVMEQMREWAARECPQVDVDSETVIFLDHEFERPKNDWVATWRNWLRNAPRFNGGGNARTNKPDRGPFAGAPRYIPRQG